MFDPHGQLQCRPAFDMLQLQILHAGMLSACMDGSFVGLSAEPVSWSTLPQAAAVIPAGTAQQVCCFQQAFCTGHNQVTSNADTMSTATKSTQIIIKKEIEDGAFSQQPKWPQLASVTVISMSGSN